MILLENRINFQNELEKLNNVRNFYSVFSILKIFKNNPSIAFYSAKELIFLISNKVYLSQKEIKSYRKLLNRWTRKGLLLKSSVKYLYENNIIKKSVYEGLKQYRYVYFLQKEAYSLIGYFFPDEYIIKFNHQAITSFAPLCFLTRKINSLLNKKNKYKYRKETILSFLDSNNVFKVGRNYYIKIACDLEKLKRIIPIYPFITFNFVRKLLNESLPVYLAERILNKIFEEDIDKKVKYADFVIAFQKILTEYNKKETIKKIIKIKKGGIYGEVYRNTNDRS